MADFYWVFDLEFLVESNSFLPTTFVDVANPLQICNFGTDLRKMFNENFYMKSTVVAIN